MESSSPLVSIGLPVFNGSNFIEAAIESILSQSYSNLELIICDNASTDETVALCKRFVEKDPRVEYFRQEKNLGATRNFNSTFEKTRGKYFKWASHDDLLGPNYIADCVNFLEQHNDYIICWPHMDYVGIQGEFLHPQNVPNLSIQGPSFKQRIRTLFDFQKAGDDVIPTIFALMRSDALRSTNLWQRFVSSEEILMLELLRQGKAKQLEQTAFFFRVHDDSAFQKNRTPRERGKWFDTDKRTLLQLPVWYLLARYFSTISQSNISIFEKIGCYYEVVRRAFLLWRRYAGDLIKYIGQFIGYRHRYKSR